MASGDTVPAVGGSTVFKENNNPTTTAIWNNYDTCGSMTRADVGLAESGDLDAIFTDAGASGETMGNFDRYRDMESLLVTQLELKACGGRQYGMYDWLMSGAKSMGKGITKRNVAGGASEIEPFILAAQKDVIKDDYWLVDKLLDHDYKYETSATTSAPTIAPGGAVTHEPALSATVSAAGGQFVLRVEPAGNNPVDIGYFKDGVTVNLFAKAADAGAAYRVAFKVVSAKAVTVSNVNYIDVGVKYQSGWGAGADIGATFAFDDATPASKIGASGTGGAGVVVIGANNVNDFESWCENRPALNTLKHVPFWYQTSRSSLCVSEFYKEWLERMLRTNAFFNKFGDVSLAERNAQLGLMQQKEWVNSFFWGQPISDKQKLSSYKELGVVSSVDSSILGDQGSDLEGAAIGYKANAIGVYRQLADCGRVSDKAGEALDLSTFLEGDIFDLVRSRKDQGKQADSIDVFTDSKTAKNIFNAMMVYYKNESDSMLNVNYDITNKNVSNMGFYANSYKLHYPAGVTLNVITNEFFDDMVTAHKAGDQTASGGITDGSQGRFLMVLDLGGGIYPGIIGSNRVVHKTGDLADLAKVDPSYRCVMKNPTKETTLNSTTWTAIVECPTDNLIIENFADTTITQ